MFPARSKDCATKTELAQLRDDLTTKLDAMRMEQRSFTLGCEDILDKIDHISKRTAKRRERAAAADATQEGGDGQTSLRLNPLAQALLKGSGT